MKRILLDASFVIEAVKSKVDIAQALGMVVPRSELAIPVVVFEEVEQNGTKLCVSMLEHLRPTILTTKSITGDDALLESAKLGDYIATLDKELKRRAKARGIKVLTLRQRKYVEEV